MQNKIARDAQFSVAESVTGPSHDLCMRLKYDDGLSQIVVTFLTITLPLWGYYLPLLLMPHQLRTFTSVVAPLICGGLLFFYWLRSTRLSIDRFGMVFPAQFLFALGGKLERGWAELEEVDFHYGATLMSKKPDSVTFRFADKAEVTLCSSTISTMAMERLFLAVESFATELQIRSSTKKLYGEEKSTTFTQLWEEDLCRRFSSTSFVPLEPDQRLGGGRLTILGQLAFGGLSAIYLVKVSGQKAILKEACIPEGTKEAVAQKAVELFAREAQLLMGLRHARIAKVLDHFVENNRNYLLLELIEGRDLRRLINENGPQSEKVVLRWAIQIAELLEYIHGQEPPIIHRDVTPENVVLNGYGQTILIDFGAANLYVGAITGTVVGKQAYMAPEQIQGKATPQSDIYSFGCMLMFLLTGQDPEPITKSSPKSFGLDISAELSGLVERCTELDPQARPKSASQVLQLLKQIGGHA